MAAFRIGVLQGKFPQISATFIVDQLIGLMERGAELKNIPLDHKEDAATHDDVRIQRIFQHTEYIVRLLHNRRRGEHWCDSLLELNPFLAEHFDIFQVHYGNVFISLLPFFEQIKQPVVVSFHGHDASRWIQQHGDNCYKPLFSRAQLITTPSYTMKERLEKIGCPDNKIMVHRYGIDLDRFAPVVKPLTPPGTLRLLSVGRLVDKKGHRYAIEAMAKLDRSINCELNIIGEGDDYSKLTELAAELGVTSKVNFLGAQPRNIVLEEFGKADAFILPSVVAENGDEEGVPVSLIEAQAMGLPVISSIHSGIPELVNNGISGLLFPEKDSVGLAYGISTLAMNPGIRVKMGEAGREIVENQFNINTLNDTLFKTLAELSASSRDKDLSTPETERLNYRPPKVKKVKNAPVEKAEPVEHVRSVETTQTVQQDEVSRMNHEAEQAAIRGDMVGALELLMKVLAKNPQFFLAHSNLGVVHFRLGNLKLAEKHLRIANALKPVEAGACGNLCHVLRATGKEVEAFELAKKFLEKQHDDAINHFANEVEACLTQANLDRERALQEMAAVTSPLSAQIATHIPATLPQAMMLKQNLSRLGWEDKEDRFSPYFEYVEHRRIVSAPSVSIVIISWRFVPELVRTLESLEMERDLNFEFIFVDNGSDPHSFDPINGYVDTWVRLNENTGAYLARNIGASFAHAPIIMFLEDDGVPRDGIIKAHLDAHYTYDVYSVRGAVVPLVMDDIHERIKERWQHYHLGDVAFPACLNFEGNASYRSEMFFGVGGWDDDINFGHGGPELAIRIIGKDPDRRKHMYTPDALLYHNYVKGEEHYVSKMQKQSRSLERLKSKYHGYDIIRASWASYRGRNDLLIRRGAPKYKVSGERAPITWSDYDQLLNTWGWQNKTHRYRPLFDFAETVPSGDNPIVSVVMISWRFVKETLMTLEILSKEKGFRYEVIFVNNGGTEEEFAQVRPMVDTYLRLNENAGAYLPRNMGAVLARAPYLLFLEDDGIPQVGLIQEHLNNYSLFEIDCCRGVYKYKTSNELNELQSHYSLGNSPGPSFMGLEGNMSITREIFYEVGGWDDDIRFGGGGLDLSIRLLAIEPDFRRQMYSPGPAILHDYCSDPSHLESKKAKQDESHARLRLKYPQLNFYLNIFNMFNGLIAGLRAQPTRQDDVERLSRGYTTPEPMSIVSRHM